MFRFGDPGGRAYNTVGASSANLLAWWTAANSNPGNFSITSSGGRSGGNSLHARLAAVSYISKAFNNQPTWGIACAVKFSSLAGGGNWGTFLTVQDSVSATIQLELRVGSDGSLRICRNNGGNNGTTNIFTTTSPGIIVTNAWIHLEWLSTINSTTGSTQIWINGASVLNMTGQNTQASVNAFASNIYIGNLNADVGVTLDYDDIIIYDGQTTDPAGNPDIFSQIGDCALGWLQPTGAGTTTQFVPDSGSNFARVNEATPDGDASYVDNLTIGNTDTYAMSDLPAGATSVKSLAVVQYARKTDTGARGIKAVLHTGGADFAFANEIALGTSYGYTFSNWGRNPSGPAAWTPTTVNSLETGQKVSS